MADRSVTETERPPVIAVVSPKGGSGKTTVAVNMSVALARRSPTLLVDLDVYAGDVEYALGLRPELRLDDLVRRVSANEVGEVDLMLASHPSGVSVLCAPDNPVIADQLSPADTLTAIDRLIDLRRPVVLDTGSGVDSYTLGVLDRASHVLVVGGTDVSPVHAARKMIAVMSRTAIGTDRIHVIVNRAAPRLGLTIADVETALRRSVALTIPDLTAIRVCSNAGVPITVSAPDSRVSRTFFNFADELAGIGFAQSRRWPFGWPLRPTLPEESDQ